MPEERGGQRESTESLPQLSLRKRKVMSKTRDILFPKTLKGDTEAAAELPLEYPRPLPRTGLGRAADTSEPRDAMGFGCFQNFKENTASFGLDGPCRS